MSYQKRRRLYSQNFLHSPELVNKLIRHSSLGKKDTVLEIGPGRGIITSVLVEIVDRVEAVELDTALYKDLTGKFGGVKNLRLHNQDFFDFSLPKIPYKVFSNIPFVITADVIRKLTADKNFQEGYLVVQKEAAQRFIGKPYDYKNQMMATLLKPWFEISVFWEFNRSDFVPVPKVNTTMIRIIRASNPVIPVSQKENYIDFILYAYNRYKISYYDFSRIINMFKEYGRKNVYFQNTVRQKSQKILKDQKSLFKIHRTRKDQNWRSF